MHARLSRLGIYTLVVLTVASTAVPASASVFVKDGRQVYFNERYGYMFLYPKGWVAQPNAAVSDSVVVADMKTVKKGIPQENQTAFFLLLNPTLVPAMGKKFNLKKVVQTIQTSTMQTLGEGGNVLEPVRTPRQIAGMRAFRWGARVGSTTLWGASFVRGTVLYSLLARSSREKVKTVRNVFDQFARTLTFPSPMIAAGRADLEQTTEYLPPRIRALGVPTGGKKESPDPLTTVVFAPPTAKDSLSLSTGARLFHTPLIQLVGVESVKKPLNMETLLGVYEQMIRQDVKDIATITPPTNILIGDRPAVSIKVQYTVVKGGFSFPLESRVFFLILNTRYGLIIYDEAFAKTHKSHEKLLNSMIGSIEFE